MLLKLDPGQKAALSFSKNPFRSKTLRNWAPFSIMPPRQSYSRDVNKPLLCQMMGQSSHPTDSAQHPQRKKQGWGQPGVYLERAPQRRYQHSAKTEKPARWTKPSPSSSKMHCFRRVCTSTGSSSRSCSRAMICSSLRHTLSWA